MELKCGDEVVEQVKTDQHAGRGDTVVLVAVPAKGLSQFVLARQTEPAPVGGPKPEALPAQGLEILIECGDRKLEKIAKKPGQQLLSGLDKGALGDRKLARAEPVKKLVELDRQSSFKQRNIEPYNTLEEQRTAARKVAARPAKVMLGLL